MSPKRQRRTADKKQPATGQHAGGERLQKVLAAAGVASRRECEELILAGRVEVDRETVLVLGTRVDAQRQEIRVDSVPLPKPRLVYYLLNKPAGVVSTNRDPDGRTRVVDLVPADKRLFTIGRLDRSSEGMIIVTNDGELANQLTHPRYGIAKTYRARVAGNPTAETLDQLRTGVQLAEGAARVAALRVRGRQARCTELEIVLTEGRNREIRRILAKVGHKVQYLRRIAIGSIKMGQLEVGEYRHLSAEEVRILRREVRATGGRGPGSRQGKAISQRARSVRASQGRSRAGKSQPPGGTQPAGRPHPRGAADAEAKPRRPSGQSRGTSKPRTGTVLEYDRPDDSTQQPSARSAQKRTFGAAKKRATGAAKKRATGAGKKRATGAGKKRATGASKKRAGGASKKRAGGKPPRKGKHR